MFHLSILREFTYGKLALRGFSLAKQALHQVEQLSAPCLDKDGVAGSELPEDLLCQDDVKHLGRGSSACDIGRDEHADLPHDTVSEAHLEGILKEFVHLGYLGKVPRGQGIPPLGLRIEPVEPLEGDVLPAVGLLHAERRGTCVQVEHRGPVVDLVRDGEGRVVVVGRPDEPNVLRKQHRTVDHPLRVVLHAAGGYLEDPCVLVGKLEEREELGKIVFHPGDVDLVEDDHADGVARPCPVEGGKERRLAELAGELVVVSEKVAPLLPGGLDGDDGRRTGDELAEGDRKGGLSRSGHTLEKQDPGTGQACDEGTDVPLGIVET